MKRKERKMIKSAKYRANHKTPTANTLYYRHENQLGISTKGVWSQKGCGQ